MWRWVNKIQGRKLALWGGFHDPYTERFTLSPNDAYGWPRAELFLSNTRARDGSTFQGIPVLHPEHFTDWKNYYILVMTKSYDEVKRQLLELGLKELEDFTSFWQETALDIQVPLLPVQNTLKNALLHHDAYDFSAVVRSKQEFEAVCRQYCSAIAFENALRELYRQLPQERGRYIGTCNVCSKTVSFDAPFSYPDGSRRVLRESMICPCCAMNSRERLLYDYITKEDHHEKAFMLERVTTQYAKISEQFPNLLGSEYLDDKFESGSIHDNVVIGNKLWNGLMHQNAMALSFADESYDLIISAEVMEHVQNYHKAFSEAARCLKKGGKFISSFPILFEREKTELRAAIDAQGNVQYLLPPVYHGNPLSAQGALVYADFGWDVIDALREAGFSDAYAIIRFSTEYAFFEDYAGNSLPVVIEAIK